MRALDVHSWCFWKRDDRSSKQTQNGLAAGTSWQRNRLPFPGITIAYHVRAHSIHLLTCSRRKTGFWWHLIWSIAFHMSAGPCQFLIVLSYYQEITFLVSFLNPTSRIKSGTCWETQSWRWIRSVSNGFWRSQNLTFIIDSSDWKTF